MIPANPGKAVVIVVEQHTASGWKPVVSWSHKLNSRSRWTFPIRYRNATVIGKRYRILAEYKGGTKFAAVAWGYWYFKITQ